MEPDQINVLTFTVLRDFEEVEDAKETRLARQLRSDAASDFSRRTPSRRRLVKTMRGVYTRWGFAHKTCTLHFRTVAAVYDRRQSCNLRNCRRS